MVFFDCGQQFLKQLLHPPVVSPGLDPIKVPRKILCFPQKNSELQIF